MDTYVYIHSIYWIGKADKENGLEKLGKNSNFALWRVQFLAKIALLKVQFKGNFQIQFCSLLFDLIVMRGKITIKP